MRVLGLAMLLAALGPAAALRPEGKLFLERPGCRLPSILPGAAAANPLSAAAALASAAATAGYRRRSTCTQSPPLRPLGASPALQPTCCCRCLRHAPTTGLRQQQTWRGRGGRPAARRAAAAARSRGSA